MLAIGGELDTAFVLPGILSDDNPASSALSDAFHVTFPDGAVIEYESESGALNVSCTKPPMSPGRIQLRPLHPMTSGQQQIRWMWPNKSPANAGLFSMSGQCVEVTRNKFFYFIWLRQKNGLRKGDYTGQGGGSW